jgi:hypothetical protein
MNFFKLTLIVLYLATYVNGAKKIYLFGEQHGNTGNKIRQESWEKYERGEIEYLCDGSLTLKTREDFNRQQQFMIDWHLGHIFYSFKRSQFLFWIASFGDAENYQGFKNKLKVFQTSNKDKTMVDLPDCPTDGIKKAKELFYQHWKYFTEIAANNDTGLEIKEWRNFHINLEKDKYENFQIMKQCEDLLTTFRNLLMAQKIANKFKQSKKDVYVHLGEDHRVPVEKHLRNVYKIPENNLQSNFLKETQWLYK